MVNIWVRTLKDADIKEIVEIWNQVVEDGVEFPQTEYLKVDFAWDFLLLQTHVGVAIREETGEVVGLYTLHPNNVGRCKHICNASFAVRRDMRRQGIGEKLVLDCMEKARVIGFRILEFNAVVKSNTAALELYKKLGFTQLGVIPGGFQIEDEVYEDIIPHYIEL